MINKIIAEEKIQQVRKLLEKKEKIVITCHWGCIIFLMG